MLPILIGGAVLSALFGAKKGIDASDDKDKAKKYNKKAMRLFNEAQEQLDEQREDTNSELESLGELKLSIYTDSVKRFESIYKKIKGVKLSGFQHDNSELDFENTLLEMRDVSLSMQEIAAAGVSSLGAGALAGLGAYGGAMTLATASTGTAIGTLSGVAATNATLAWFGGGSLAAGGLGMTAGAAVLGGIVAGPVLMIAGWAAAEKAKEAKATALSNLKEVEVQVEIMEIATSKARAIELFASELSTTLAELDSHFKPFMDELDSIVNPIDAKKVTFLSKILNLVGLSKDASKDFDCYNSDQKYIVEMCVLFVATLHKLMSISIMDDVGELLEGSFNKFEELQGNANNLLENIRNIRNS